MWRDRNKNQVSGIAVALFVVSVAAGFGLMALSGSRVPLIAGLVIGAYLLFQSRSRISGRRLRCCGWAASSGCEGRACSTWFPLSTDSADMWIRESGFPA